MRHFVRSISMLMLVLVLVVQPAIAQDSTPTPEGTEEVTPTAEATVEVTPVVVPPVEDPADTIEDLQERVDTLTNQNTVLLGVVVALFLALAVAGVYLARSVPAGAHGDLLKLFSDVLVKEGAGAALTKFEDNAKLSDSQIDDILAAAGRAGYKFLYPAQMAVASETVEAQSGAEVTANVYVEVVEEKNDTQPKG